MFTSVLAAVFLGEQMTWRKVMGLLLGVAGVAVIVAHRIFVGTDSTIGIAFSVGALVSIVAGTILFKVLAPKSSCGLGNGVQNLSGGLALVPFAFMFANVSDIVPSGRYLRRWLSWCCSARSWPTCSGSTCSPCSARDRSQRLAFVMPPLGMSNT